MHIRDLRRIRPMLNLKTASTIATSIVHAKLDYCNSLFLNLDFTQINRLQAIQNVLVHAVTKTPKHHNITPVLKKLHWLKIHERIEYKVISLTYNMLQSSQPSYLRQLFTIQPPRSTIGVDSGGSARARAPPIIKIGGAKPLFLPPNNQTRIFNFFNFC